MGNTVRKETGRITTVYCMGCRRAAMVVQKFEERTEKKGEISVPVAKFALYCAVCGSQATFTLELLKAEVLVTWQNISQKKGSGKKTMLDKSLS